MNANLKSRAARYRSYKAGDDAFRGAGRPLACGKLCHESKSRAKAAIRRLAGSGLPRKAGVLTAYRCERCQAWHVGHERAAGEAMP